MATNSGWLSNRGTQNKGWFSDLGSYIPSFQWGGGAPPAMPEFYPRNSPEGGRQLPPPNDIPPMPPVPNGSGTQTAWGGPQLPNASVGGVTPPAPTDAPADPFDTGGMQAPGGDKKYSFLDNPGASDALVAFGAAMLKAPTFNQGLGDAALAVNDVAKSYRMPTEQDYARAKQLGMVQRIARGYNEDGSRGTSGLKVDQKNPMYGPDNKLYWPATDANGNPGVWDVEGNQFVPGGIEGLTRATDSAVGPRNRFGEKQDADAEQQLYTEAMASNDNITQLQQMKSIAPSAGVGLDFGTRIGGQLATLLGEPVGSIDPTSVSTLQASAKQLGLNWSQKMRGQGQVTEQERKMIQDMLPQALMDPQAFSNLVDTLTQIERRKQTLANEWFSNRDAMRQQYGSLRGFMLARVGEMPIVPPTTGNGPASPPTSDSGSTNSGVKWKIVK